MSCPPWIRSSNTDDMVVSWRGEGKVAGENVQPGLHFMYCSVESMYLNSGEGRRSRNGMEADLNREIFTWFQKLKLKSIGPS